KDLLSSFFFFISLFNYLHYTRKPMGSRSRVLRYIASIVLFALGLLSKGTILLLPFILLLLDYVQKRPWERGLLLEKIPFFSLSVLFGVIALGGKRDVLAATTLLEKVLLAAKTTFFFLLKFLVPRELTVSYPQLSPITLSSVEFLIPVILLILLIISVCLLIRHSFVPFAIPLSPEVSRRIVFCVLFSFLTLAPSYAAISKGISIYVFADRYGYLPSIGLLLLLGMFIVSMLTTSENAQTFRRKRVLIAATSIMMLLFCRLTVRQSLLWGKWGAFMEKTTEYNPHFYRPFIDLGASYRMEGKSEKAIQAYRRALELYELPNVYGLIGQIYAERGELEKAIEEFRTGILLNPSDAELHHGLGQVYALQRNFDAALREYERALALMPEPKNAYEKLSRRIIARRDVVLERIGILYGERGDHARAVEYYEKALLENPSFADAHFNLAVGLGNLGKREEALKHYEEAVRLEPSHIRARVNLAILYAEKGRKREAMTLLQQVLEEDPKNSIAHEALEKMQRMR
ncbi:MAG: tetratricopeptide repeat protein, partial [Patescibacteria group bacterium]